MPQASHPPQGDTTIRIMLGWAKKRLKKRLLKAAEIISPKPAKRDSEKV